MSETWSRGLTFDRERSRSGKLLNPLNIIRFPNDVCTASSATNTEGTCYSASECASRGGSSSGSCASGFGVCCLLQAGCGDNINTNNTYWSSAGASSPCTLTVCKASSDICFIRLDFDEFSLSSPVTTITPQTANPIARGQCQTAQFTATSSGISTPTLCGSNTGYHMILDADEACNRLSVSWTGSTSQSWNIQVSQISCDSSYAPDEGCLQWYTGVSGTIYSYNYPGSVHLASQDYSNCIRAEQSYCSIQYTACDTTSFQMTGTAATSAWGDDCNTDYVHIQDGSISAGATSTYDRYCGGLLTSTDIPSTTTSTTVFTARMPYQVGVVTDATEVDTANANENSKGFCILYEQIAC